MNENIPQNIKLSSSQITKLKELGIDVVYLFGSYAEGVFSPLSDVDIGIIFEGKRVPQGAQAGAVYNILYDIFTDVFPGKNVDIVFLQKATLELCFDVISHGKPIYESSKEKRFDFEERISLMYADFKVSLLDFNRAILSRI